MVCVWGGGFGKEERGESDAGTDMDEGGRTVADACEMHSDMQRPMLSCSVLSSPHVAWKSDKGTRGGIGGGHEVTGAVNGVLPVLEPHDKAGGLPVVHNMGPKLNAGGPVDSM